ncbi:hypothetical protein AQUCO_08800012v1 [Aquilegia coerulea]|uniref:Uncharacterized protein n=1 Tax=Aquilegia coerulea TaxID=218851 RepID=A0A2G5C696_AQUCA|nr:hypothetical protein AQUCO_08800012v1 [Aquilegia coerulea]
MFFCHGAFLQKCLGIGIQRCFKDLQQRQMKKWKRERERERESYIETRFKCVTMFILLYMKHIGWFMIV